jgi:hypothetical protein
MSYRDKALQLPGLPYFNTTVSSVVSAGSSETYE